MTIGGIIILIILILIVTILVLTHFDPAIEKISYRGYKEARLWYNVWSKRRDVDVCERKCIVLYKKRIEK